MTDITREAVEEFAHYAETYGNSKVAPVLRALRNALDEAETERDRLRHHERVVKSGNAYKAIAAERDAAIARAEAAERANEWIDVNSRRPTIAGNYLLRFANGDQQVFQWLPNEDPPGFWYGDPTHWRPLLADPCAALAKEGGNETR